MSAASVEFDAPVTELLREVADFCRSRGMNAWATGGFLRDALLGRPPRDVDICVDGDPLEIGPALAEAIGAHFVVLDEERRHARLVPMRDAPHVDLMGLRAASIDGDLRERDFTIDALAASLQSVVGRSPALLDPTGGVSDLDGRTVRATGERQLLDDPLRVLRGVRIAIALGFDIEPQTRAWLTKHAGEIRRVASERVREELMLVFGSEAAARGVRLLEEMRLLSVILPEVDVMRGVEQPKEHYHDVFGHAVATVEALDVLLAGSPPSSPTVWSMIWEGLDWAAGLRGHLEAEVAPGIPRFALLKFCGLLHDIGKPATKSIEEGGRIRFFGHGVEGAEIAVTLMRRLRFSGRAIEIVRRMIEAHLRPVQMGQQGPPTRRAIYRFFRDTGDAGVDTLILSLADHLGTVGPRVNLDGFRQHVALVDHILQVRVAEPEVISPPPLVRGGDLIRELGIREGPLVGHLLAEIKEAQAAGEIATHEEALGLARRKLLQTGRH